MPNALEILCRHCKGQVGFLSPCRKGAKSGDHKAMEVHRAAIQHAGLLLVMQASSSEPAVYCYAGLLLCGACTVMQASSYVALFLHGTLCIALSGQDIATRMQLYAGPIHEGLYKVGTMNEVLGKCRFVPRDMDCAEDMEGTDGLDDMEDIQRHGRHRGHRQAWAGMALQLEV